MTAQLDSAPEAEPRRPAELGAWRARVAGLSGYTRGVMAITAAAFASRVILLGSVPRLWGDEAFTGVAVRQSLWAMLDVVRHDNHPPLGYILVRAVALVSTSPGALRLVSAIAGTAAVPAAAALGRRVRGDRAGLLAAAAVAAYPQFLLTSRDTRMYALATTAVLLATLALWRAIEKPTSGRVVTYAACVALAVYSHYFAILAIATQLPIALAVFRPPPRSVFRLSGACAIGGLALTPWLVVALPQLQHVGAPFWIPRLTLATAVPDLAATLSLPAVQAAMALAQWVGAIAAVVLLVLLLRELAPSERRGATYLLACAALPTAALVLVSFWKPLYDARFAGIFWAAAVALLGVALTAFKWRWVAVGAVAILALVATATLLQVRNPDFDALTAPAAASTDRGDVVLVNGPAHYFSVAYALGPNKAGEIKVLADDVPWYFGVAGYPPGTQVRDVQDLPAVPLRIFLVTDEGQRTPDLSAGFNRLGRTCQDGVCLETHVRVHRDPPLPTDG